MAAHVTGAGGWLLRYTLWICQNQDFRDYGDLQDWDDALHRHVIAGLIRNPDGQVRVSVRIRIIEDYGDLQDWDDALHRFHPLIPVSGTGTGLSPGGIWLICTCSPASHATPLDCGPSPQRACATVVSVRYSAWRFPALWILGSSLV